MHRLCLVRNNGYTQVIQHRHFHFPNFKFSFHPSFRKNMLKEPIHACTLLILKATCHTTPLTLAAIIPMPASPANSAPESPFPFFSAFAPPAILLLQDLSALPSGTFIPLKTYTPTSPYPLRIPLPPPGSPSRTWFCW